MRILHHLFHETGLAITVGVNLWVELVHERRLAVAAATVGRVVVAAEVALNVVLALASEAGRGWLTSEASGR